VAAETIAAFYKAAHAAIFLRDPEFLDDSKDEKGEKAEKVKGQPRNRGIGTRGKGNEARTTLNPEEEAARDTAAAATESVQQENACVRNKTLIHIFNV